MKSRSQKILVCLLVVALGRIAVASGQIPVVQKSAFVPPAPIVQAPADSAANGLPLPVIQQAAAPNSYVPVPIVRVAPVVSTRRANAAPANPPVAGPTIHAAGSPEYATPASLPLPIVTMPPPAAVSPPSMGNSAQPLFDPQWTPVSAVEYPFAPQDLAVDPVPIIEAPRVDAPMVMSEVPVPSMVQGSGPITGENYLDLPGQQPMAMDSGSGMQAGCYDGCGTAYGDVNGGSGFRPTGLFGMGSMVGTGPVFGMRDSLSMGGTQYGQCGNMPDASNYFFLEGLYWTRNDDGLIGTTFGGVGGDEWAGGIRATFGGRTDQVSGLEVSFFGLDSIELEATQTDPAGNIDAVFTPGTGFGFLQLGSFFNATDTFQRFSTDLQSFSFNRVRYAWDVARSHVGVRVLYMQDEYQLDSSSAANGNGTLGIGARNVMLGPEIGIDFLYDVGRQVSYSYGGKAAGYVNAVEVDTVLINNGIQYLNNQARTGRAAASIELNGNVYYHFTRTSRFKLGYNTLWLWGIASSNDNFPFVLSPFTGVDADTSDNTFFHGLNFGFEFYR